jgi:hypothetical protein
LEQFFAFNLPWCHWIFSTLQLDHWGTMLPLLLLW